MIEYGAELEAQAFKQACVEIEDTLAALTTPPAVFYGSEFGYC